MTDEMDRREFIGTAVAAGAAVAGVGALGTERKAMAAETDGKAKVWFTDDISVAGLLKVFEHIKSHLSGKVAIKLHTGEPHGPNLLPRELIQGLQATIPNSTIVECNTLYPGGRYTTEQHRETLKVNGWTFCPVDIMDAKGEVKLPVKGLAEFLAKGDEFGKKPSFVPGTHLTEVTMGKTITRYNSMLVYTHFKGHAMGGFGGSLKNIGIGCASGHGGKREIHGWGWPGGDAFHERMVESGKAVCDHFGEHIVFINVLKNISVDCDCDAHGAKPTTPDLGIMASTDILAIDKACVDMVYALPEADKKDLVERIESRSGLHQLAYMEMLGMGNPNYELIKI